MKLEKILEYCREFTGKFRKNTDSIHTKTTSQAKPASLVSPPLGARIRLVPDSAAVEPNLQKIPWEGRMVLEPLGSGSTLKYPLRSMSSLSMRWVSREKNEQGEPLTVRTPQESHTVTHVLLPFRAGGRHYAHISQLMHRRDNQGDWFEDIYGRQVLHIQERFPCFDSYDYLHENRYYHWFLIREPDRLTRLYYTDSQDMLFITTDVLHLEEKCWEEMKKHHFFD